MLSETIRETLRLQVEAMNRAEEERRRETWDLIERIKRGEKIEFKLPEFRIPFRVGPA